MKRFFFLIFVDLLIQSCDLNPPAPSIVPMHGNLPDQFIVVLGIAQDAGYPQIGCEKACCKAYWEGREEKKLVTCLALVDRTTDQYWLFEATPDITEQLKKVQSYIKTVPDYSPDGIFLTHAHIGHYTGLMEFGREAMGASNIPVWVMPKMDTFLRNNGPWSQLVQLKNIELNRLNTDSGVSLNSNLHVLPVRVPHRDEYSETVGFIISSKKKKILFIPDIDKWEKWNRKITSEVMDVDTALLDGSFYKNGELPGRDMSEIPHPFVEETMKLFSSIKPDLRSKIFFIHFNHTNPLLSNSSPERITVSSQGFGIASEEDIITL